PGGKIGVYEGMFQVAENEAQLAAVVGHEIAHNQAQHAQQRLSSQAATELGTQVLGAVLQGGNVGGGQQIAALLGAGAQYGLILPYSRNQELEADRLGLLMMARAGYDPRAAVQLWRNMGAAGGARPPEFMSTHPGPESRIARLEELVPEAQAVYEGS
ncbi:M48 family metallopeptidase, partial [Arenibaculum sp.]|uniref:M48 family metallopeptidase n=1 Tax=Arenibaculum sp. TaxID=2865862 RepID=UPI002E107036|nr:M48 family metallopeptidase [Arenibaculum sp.]